MFIHIFITFLNIYLYIPLYIYVMSDYSTPMVLDKAWNTLLYSFLTIPSCMITAFYVLITAIIIVTGNIYVIYGHIIKMAAPTDTRYLISGIIFISLIHFASPSTSGKFHNFSY